MNKPGEFNISRKLIVSDSYGVTHFDNPQVRAIRATSANISILDTITNNILVILVPLMLVSLTYILIYSY